MANFKVVFRSDNQGAGTSPGWEPGCPLLVNAVQVSRNTDTGQCYLQLKLSNISGATVNSFKLQADVSYVDGANETAELNPLDADIQPAKTYRPEPVLLTGSQITNVIVRVLSVSQPEIEWHAEAGSEPGPIPVGTELVLDKKAATERTKSFMKKSFVITLQRFFQIPPCGNTWQYMVGMFLRHTQCRSGSVLQMRSLQRLSCRPRGRTVPYRAMRRTQDPYCQTKEKDIDRERLFHHCRSCCFSHFVLYNGYHRSKRLL